MKTQMGIVQCRGEQPHTPQGAGATPGSQRSAVMTPDCPSPTPSPLKPLLNFTTLPWLSQSEWPLKPLCSTSTLAPPSGALCAPLHILSPPLSVPPSPLPEELSSGLKSPPSSFLLPSGTVWLLSGFHHPQQKITRSESPALISLPNF